MKVSNSEAEIPVSATIFRYQAPALPKPFYSDLLDFGLGLISSEDLITFITIYIPLG